MLNEVTRLCKGDFSGINKEFEIWQMDEFTPAFKIASFKSELEAQQYIDKVTNESKDFDEFTCFEIKEVKYEQN